MYRWINKETHRYYNVYFDRDLFGDWMLISAWGGMDSRLSGMKAMVVESEAAGEAAIRNIDKRRRQRGYLMPTLPSLIDRDPKDVAS